MKFLRGYFRRRSAYQVKTILLCILMVITLIVFWPTLNNDFIHEFDDGQYVIQNPNIIKGLSKHSVIWAFTSVGYLANWHPLTWLSHMLDTQLFGLDPRGHHTVNLLIHLINTGLLFLLLTAMTSKSWQSFFVSALFAVHPLHVETVAWIAERKGLLSTSFLLLAAITYNWYVRKPGTGRYMLLAVMFTLSLMAKAMAVTLPFVFLLLDYWPLNRWHTIRFSSPKALTRQVPVPSLMLFWEKIPLFILALLSSHITLLAQQKGGALASTYNFPLEIRIFNAFTSYATYIGKMFWPTNLAVFYPHAGRSIPMGKAMGAGLLLLCLTIIVISLIRKFPWLALGWFWFLGTLVPVIGLVQLAGGARADRYTYVPLIGLFIVIAWIVPKLTVKLTNRTTALAASATLVLITLMIMSRVQVGYWRSAETLFLHTLKVTSDNAIAQNNLGSFKLKQGKLFESIEHFSEALKINPNYDKAHYNIGLALAETHRNKEAVWHLKMYIKLNPEGPFGNYSRSLIKYLETRPDGS